MFTRVQSRAFVVLSLALVSIGHSLHGQSVTSADTASQDGKIDLSYVSRDLTDEGLMSWDTSRRLKPGFTHCRARA